MTQRNLQFVLLITCISFMIACNPKSNIATTNPFPGEWEQQSSIWMGTPTYENIAGKSSIDVQAEMIKAIAPNEFINMAVQDSAEMISYKAELISRGVSATLITNKVRFVVLPHNDIWFRDMGGIFLKNIDSTYQMVDFNFNGWGYGPYTNAFYRSGFTLDEGVDKSIATQLGLGKTSTTMILEGGAIESNGKGTIIAVKSVIQQRNPGMSIAAAEAELKRVLKATKVIWLNKGLGNDVHAVEGSPYTINNDKIYTPVTTNGHTDEFVRFINDHTILLAEVTAAEATDTISKFSRAALLDAENILSTATDQNGNPFTIIRMPDPTNMFVNVSAGDGTFDFLKSLRALKIKAANPIKIVMASSYLNYVVANNVVLVAKYAAPGRPAILATKDAQAVAILQAAFPGRTVVQVDVTNINVGGGGMHCITQQVPQ
jgi:agmatine deiminase